MIDDAPVPADYSHRVRIASIRAGVLHARKIGEEVGTSAARDRAYGSAARGQGADPMTPSARWKRESDIPNAVLFRATEAGP